MSVFYFLARVLDVVDGDTIDVHPLVYRRMIDLRVRFKDTFAPEDGEPGAEEATRQAREMFPPGSLVVLTNTRHRWTYERLEARVDRYEKQ